MDFNVLGHFRKPITSTIQEKYQQIQIKPLLICPRPFTLRFRPKSNHTRKRVQSSNSSHNQQQPSSKNKQNQPKSQIQRGFKNPKKWIYEP